MNKKIISLQIFVFVGFIFLWKFVIFVFNFPEFILPQPETVFIQWYLLLKSGLLLKHTMVTLSETLIGFTIGIFLGIVPGYFVAKSSKIDQTLSPYLVALQTAPKIALAPLIVMWFGFGILSKIIIVALIVFFPILVNIIVGIRSVDKNLLDLMKILNASKLQVLRLVELPASMPVLFAAFKTGITLAVIGAVVGEFIGANEGLGYLTIYAAGLMDTPQVFVAIFQLTIIGILLYLLIDYIEGKIIPWYREGEVDVVKNAEY
ncbi:MAG: ABC transporter permease [Candidatus Nanohalarchaeota archaeon]|nr:MAG: ABC transporter permease [Candidatus Nanohaloarchaeota archaeon]